MSEDSRCPACGKKVVDTCYNFCPYCGQSLNWVKVHHKSTALSQSISVKTPSDVLDLIESQNLSITATTNTLINYFGSFHAIFEASPEELCQVEGMSPNAALLIASLIPVYQMYEQDKYAKKLRANRYEDIAAYCRTLFAGTNNEMCYLLCFDAQLHLIATELINRGTPTEVNVQPRVVLEIAMRHHATGVVLTHNHPSGNLEPSEDDLILTEQVKEALEFVGIGLYDHVIIAGEGDFSMKKRYWRKS